ncbi:MAG: GGDEF domain-containing protein [Rhodospirillales bacterium]
MKVGGPDGTRRPQRTGRIGGTGAPAAPSAPAAGPAQDVVSIMGIPQAELTPKVREALMQLLAEVERLRTEFEKTRARIAHLEQLADEDALVPLVNRRAFVRELSRTISFSQRYGAPSSVIYFDLNGLKRINDTHGHAAGDAALVHIAHVLVDNIRGSDLAARLGGDEFGVILAQADQKAARDKAAALAEAVAARPLDWEGHPIPLALAWGVYTFHGGEDARDALARADQEMYARKQESRPRSGT